MILYPLRQRPIVIVQAGGLHRLWFDLAILHAVVDLRGDVVDELWELTRHVEVGEVRPVYVHLPVLLVGEVLVDGHGGEIVPDGQDLAVVLVHEVLLEVVGEVVLEVELLAEVLLWGVGVDEVVAFVLFGGGF